MSESHRISTRIPVSVPLQVRVCDAESFRPLSPTASGVLSDVSEGGARIEFTDLPDGMGQVLAPGVILLLQLSERGPKFSQPLLLNVSWFRSRNGDGAALLAAVGGQFWRVPETDRRAFIDYATRKSRAAAGGANFSRWALALTAALAVMVAVDDFSVRSELTELQASVAKLESKLAAQKQLVAVERNALREVKAAALQRRMPTETVVAMAPGSAGGVAPVQPKTPKPELGRVPSVDSPSNPSPVAAAAVAPAPAATVATAAPARPGHLEVQVSDSPEGIAFTSVELLEGDFVGSLQSTLRERRTVRVELEYACAESSPCLCVVSSLQLAPNSKAEFFCTPPQRPQARLERVAARVKL